jgi:uncharacterized membrane protein
VRAIIVLAAGFTASLAGFIINSILLKHLGNKALTFYIPLVEEALKTFASVVFGAPVVPVHMVFGGVEALYDLYSSPSDYSLTASVLSLISHALLGVTAWYVFRASGSAIAAVLASTVLHSLWNTIMTGYTG